MNTCSVCLDENNNLFFCNNKDECDILICTSCFIYQLKMCNAEMKMIYCSGCKSKIYYSDIVNFKIHNIKIDCNEIIELYINLITRYLKRKHSEYLDGIAANEILIGKIIEKRHNNIKNMPLSVQKMIDMCFKKRVESIHKSNKDIISETVHNLKQICFNPNCYGKLKNNKCIVCNDVFCKDCEKPIGMNHVCDEKDLNSLLFIREDSVKCPNCSVLINKSSGCNDMRCTVCNHNFNYRNPLLPSKGNNHNDAFVYKSISTLQDILNFYNYEDNRVANIISKIINIKMAKLDIKSSLLKKSNLKIAMMYELKAIFKSFNRLYNSICSKIIHMYSINEIDIAIITNYYNILKSKKANIKIIEGMYA